MPTHKSSQKYFTHVTQSSAWTLLGAPMGSTNTPAVVADRMVNEVAREAKLFCKKPTGCCVWLDDILLYSDTIDGYFEGLNRLLKQIIAKGVRFNVENVIFYEPV